jgi:hypothetical protein
VASEAKETVAGDELALGPDDDGVVGKRVAMASSSGSKRAEVSREETKRKSAPAWQLRRG